MWRKGWMGMVWAVGGGVCAGLGRADISDSGLRREEGQRYRDLCSVCVQLFCLGCRILEPPLSTVICVCGAASCARIAKPCQPYHQIYLGLGVWMIFDIEVLFRICVCIPARSPS